MATLPENYNYGANTYNKGVYWGTGATLSEPNGATDPETLGAPTALIFNCNSGSQEVF